MLMEWIERIEAAVQDRAALDALAQEIAAAPEMGTYERETLLGRCDRYRDTLTSQAEAQELASATQEIMSGIPNPDLPDIPAEEDQGA